MLRHTRPGYHIDPERDFTDLGYARGRVSVAHGGPMGGPLEHQESYWAQTARLRREALEHAGTRVTKNPDNGVVETPISEVHP